jgi:hypothetical protein
MEAMVEDLLAYSRVGVAQIEECKAKEGAILSQPLQNLSSIIAEKQPKSVVILFQLSVCTKRTCCKRCKT